MSSSDDDVASVADDHVSSVADGKKKKPRNANEVLTQLHRSVPPSFQVCLMVLNLLIFFLQIPLGVMEVRGEAMWCGVCHVPMNYLDKSSANYHVKSSGHK